MAQTYHFKNGYIQTETINGQIEKKHEFGYIFIYAITFLITNIITEYVFLSVFSEKKTLYDVISLGAVFATIGSSLISITSILCNYSYNEYLHAKEILYFYSGNNEVHDAWVFLKSTKTILQDSEKTIQYRLFIPEVIFEFGGNNLTVPIPSNGRSIHFLILCKRYFLMETTEKVYYRYLLNNSSIDNNELFVWDCTKFLLKNTLLNKIYAFLTIIGGMFFVSGLIATLIYCNF